MEEAIEIRIPTTLRGPLTLVRWLTADGARIATDEAICELETDMASVDLPAPYAGIVEQLAKAGAALEAGRLIGRLRSVDR